ncbi:galactose oxidase-like domain-containing protein [Streptomyces sp. NPDC058739]|uniref:galactose oxidase-like domain-containing protein n=1 Tax=Streptomyces sp. NPDC058739 TaxID=3346618 RepID=UPI0036945DB6
MHLRARRPARGRTGRVLTTSLILFAAALGLGPLGAQPATAATNLVKNPGLEILDSQSQFPQCFEKSGWGDNDFSFTVTDDAHAGGKAVRIELTRRGDGDRKTMMLENSCAPQVTSGHQYDLSFWYKSTTPNVAFTIFRHDTELGWVYWTDLKTLEQSADWSRTEVRTPVIPPNTDQVTWGGALYGVGRLTTDDYAMTDATVPTGPDPCEAGGTGPECKGEWTVQTLQSPVRAIHSVLLHNGKVLLIAGSGNDLGMFRAGTFRTTLFDPVAGTYTDIPTPSDFFCAGHVQLPDGRVLVMGGNKDYAAPDGSVGYKGLRTSYVFDPATNSYVKTNDMLAGHWYPSATAMGNGDVISLGGLGEDSSGTVVNEHFSYAQNKWLPMGEAKQAWAFWGLYPSMILLQDGRLFYTGSHVFGPGLSGTGASVYDYAANTISEIPGLRRKDERDQSMSVLLPPAQDQKVITIGGGNHTVSPDAHRLVDVIDMKADSPAYVPGPNLPQGRYRDGQPQTGDQGKVYVSAVILPDGKVLETGGALHTYREDPVFEASMYDPATNAFQPGLATDPVPRTYHSSSVLLPDGRVMSIGDNPGDGSFDQRVSIYKPPYLFKGARPQITSLEHTAWAYGSTQRVTVDKPVVKASLIRPAAVTHSSDPNQRYVDLPMTVDGNTVDLSLTSNPNIAPPGYYMLSVVDANGVPSVSRWVRVGATGQVAEARVQAYAADLEKSLASGGADRAASGATGGHDHGATASGDGHAGHQGVTMPKGYDGCDHSYGTISQCVPWKFPAVPRGDRCAWLKKNGYGTALAVHGRDRHRLDRNGDGIACGRGDLVRRR